MWTGDHVSFHGPIYESLTLLAPTPITRRIKLGIGVYLLALRAAGGGGQDHGHARRALAAAGSSSASAWAARTRRSSRLAAFRTTSAARASPRASTWCARSGATRRPPSRALHRSSRACSIDPKPVQRPGPPIWIGGRSDAALARAGRQGDGWVSYVVQPERYAQSLDKIRAAAEQAGRRLDGFVAAHLDVHHGRPRLRAAERPRGCRASRGATRRTSGRSPASTGSSARPSSAPSRSSASRAPAAHYFVMNAIGDPEDERAQLEAIAAEVIPRRAQTVA